jgi:hypothetical protein
VATSAASGDSTSAIEARSAEKHNVHPAAHPFLAAIDHALDEVPMFDRAGTRVTVRVETLNTGYAQIVMMWVKPERRRLLSPIRVRLVGE